MLDTFEAVERALSAQTDASPLPTGSVMTAAAVELRRRLGWLLPEEAVVLCRWYGESARPEAIAAALGRSVRHVYRVRASAIARIVAFGQDDEFSSADVAEFV